MIACDLLIAASTALASDEKPKDIIPKMRSMSAKGRVRPLGSVGLRGRGFRLQVSRLIDIVTTLPPAPYF